MSWDTSHGYVAERRNGKQVYQHRAVMEAAIGRPLRRDEEVHHLNGDGTDNRIENLRLVSRAEHRHRTWSVLTDREIARLLLLGISGFDIAARGVGNRRVGIVRKKLGLPRYLPQRYDRRVRALKAWQRAKCASCSQPVAPCLLRLGSIRCHTCRKPNLERKAA